MTILYDFIFTEEKEQFLYYRQDVSDTMVNVLALLYL